MGFQDTSTTISLTAKLTAYGRQQLLANSSKIITHFALGDSDAYYGATLPLASGEVPSLAGNKAPNGNSSNGVIAGYAPKSLLYVNALGERKKLVQAGSTNVINSTELIGQTTLSASTTAVTATTIVQKVIDKADYETDSLVNLFYSLRLPITTADETLFTVTPSNKGGYADTSMSAISQSEILVLAVKNSEYGEMLDGRSIKIELTDTATTQFTIYSAYESTLTNDKVLDATYKEKSFNSTVLGGNIVFLFSDDIQRPNNDVTKSWATGHFATKPYSKGNKSKFNMKNDTITSTVSDKIVGIAFLDKGLIAITDPTIIANFDPTHANAVYTTVAYNSISTKVTQEVTCIIDRGEFGGTQNATFSKGDTTRISEVLLLDNANNIIAVAKTDRHIELTAQQFMALGIKITV